jgi:hypothetical protein
MTEPDQGQLDDVELDSRISPPQTGHDQIDGALSDVADLPSAPLADHHDRLAKAHEVLDEALHRPGDQTHDPESG